ncbi:hypothetical protein GY21_06775 [Cryobacterium roopkundense]|uniref:DUF418 domain-containing protein n=2 Tax=Cryobacterium roopkundense TaxID=1001240 RepID=A0A099JJI1_9MICO|nr:hypothetical protein GY21_06775 [Cryobacterium roopkundense]
MFVAHVIPRGTDSELLVDGRSAILFATLAGVSLGIMTGGAQPLVRGQRTARVESILLRALLLFALGGVLGSLNTGVAVILDYYGLMFLVLTPLLFLHRWILAGIGCTFLVTAPLLGAGRDELDGTQPPLAYFVDYYFLNGSFPILIWVPFLLVGLIAARSNLTRERTQVAMAGFGASAAGAGYGAAAFVPGVSAVAHSGTIAEVVGSGGLAISIIGGVLWITAPRRRSLGAAVRGALWPIGAIGSMALTVYTLQILALAICVALLERGGGIDYPGWPLLIGMLLASLIGASLWRYFLGTGPLERLFAAATRASLGRLPRRSRGIGTHT